MSREISEDVEIRLADCKRFKWMCGMKTACGVRLKKGWQLDTWIKKQTEFPPVPDIQDPATKGCLLHLVREISEDSSAYVAHFEEGWAVTTWPERRKITYHPTEAEALSLFIIGI